MDIKSSFKQ